MKQERKPMDREACGRLLCEQLARILQEDIDETKRVNKLTRVGNQMNNGAIAILLDTLDMLGYDVQYTGPVAVEGAGIAYFPLIAVPELGFEALRESRVAGAEGEPERTTL